MIRSGDDYVVHSNLLDSDNLSGYLHYIRDYRGG